MGDMGSTPGDKKWQVQDCLTIYISTHSKMSEAQEKQAAYL